MGNNLRSWGHEVKQIPIDITIENMILLSLKVYNTSIVSMPLG